jgi:nucleotide-binding universal stress UspA family protein
LSSELVDRCSGPANDAAAHAKELIRRELSALTGRSRGGYDVIVERGLAHLLLARIAISQNALLVVGSHMHHRIGHAFLRDVTERVVERARGPVLVSPVRHFSFCAVAGVTRKDVL